MTTQVNEQEKISENILETIDEGIISINQNWEFTYINQRCTDLMCDFEIKPSLVGKKIWEVSPCLKNSVFESTFKSVMLNSKTQTFEIQSNNKVNWYDVRVSSFKGGITVLIKDITKKKEKEIELKVSEERFAKAFEISPIALSIFKIQNNTFIDVNKSFLDLFDLKYEDVQGLV
jgi:PAS domain-containing protein